jgi:hypothetical protein
MAKQIVDNGKIEIHLADELSLERFRLQIDHHTAAKLQVIKKQIDKEIAFAHVEPKLTREGSEADTKF